MDKRIQAVLATLHPYSSEVPSDAPPEILPWEPEDRWALEGAARSAIALLLEGELPERGHEVADYLLTFNTVGFLGLRFRAEGYLPPRSLPDGHLLNGTALALFGYLCSDHPESELWRQTGCARLASVVHTRRAALEDEMLTTCLRAVCEVAEITDQPIVSDLLTLQERVWGRLISHDRAERLVTSEADFPKHMIEPVDAASVGSLLRSRSWHRGTVTPDSLMQSDLEDADGLCDNILTLRAHMLVRHQFGEEVDWQLRLFDDIESTVSLNAHIFIRNLAWAYESTGEDKYAETTARLLESWYRSCPLPNHWHFEGPWRSLEAGNRQCNMWPAAMGLVGQHEVMDEAFHAMMGRSRLDHIRYLLAYCGHANNWYQVEMSGLAVAALYSPELKIADSALRIALRRLKWINSFAYFDDGFQFELTHGYHVFPTSSLFAVVQTAKARDVALPEDFTGLVERAHDMYLFSAQPDYLLPMFNDCNPNPTDPAPLLGAAVEAFDRDDFRWGATHGKEGTAPDHCSHAWEDAGLYVMRDQWGPDGQHLFFDAAPWGASHQHDDKLSFTLYSHGRLMLGDPNIYSYAPTELTHYFKSARAHNVVMVDGKGQMRKHDPEAKLSTVGTNEWVSENGFDYVSGEYRESWGKDVFGATDVPALDTSIVHQRAVFYVKGEYWILSDLLTGEDKETHQFEQLFHPAPIYDPEGEVPIEAGTVSAEDGMIRTTDEGRGNLAIVPVDRDDLSITSRKGETGPAAGWYGVLGEFPAWEFGCEVSGTFPHRMDAVLYPMAAGSNDHATAERLYADGSVSAFEIKGAGVDDVFILCEPGCPEVMVDDIVFKGRALLVRRGEDILTHSVGAERIEVGGKPVKVK